jgi:hypothetical protein
MYERERERERNRIDNPPGRGAMAFSNFKKPK